MWFGYADGALLFEAKAKSQKVVNLRRDPRAVVMIEAGATYDQLRGVSIDGTATLIEDTTADEYWAAAINVYERYLAPYTPASRPAVETMMNNRVVVRIDPVRVRSWDHRKLGLRAMPLSGSTAVHVQD
jgi:hypothetical protein